MSGWTELPSKEEEGTGSRRGPGELVDEHGNPKKPLSEMSDKELQDFTQQRAEQLNASIHPEEAKRTTTAVTVVESPPGNKDSRKVIITSSENREPKLPNKVGDEQVNPKGSPRDSALAPNEEFRDTPPHLSKQGTVKDESGNDVPVDHTGDKSKRRDYFDENNEPYTKAQGGDDTTGETRHHAEQRAVTSQGENEGIAAMSPTKPCCAGCQNALTNSGNLDKVPPSLQGAQ